MCTSRTFPGLVLALSCTLGHATLAAAQQPTAKEPPKAPEGWVLVEENVLIVFADEPEHKMKAAHESFLKKDMEATAADLRKAAAFVKLEAARAAGDAKKGLVASATELEKLAGDVEKGTVSSSKTLEAAFARAHQALAKHHHAKATESWAAKAEHATGHELKAAAASVESAFKWGGKEMETGTEAVIKDSRYAAEKLIEGGGWVGEEVGKAIEKCGDETEKLGKWIEPAKKP
ncbi:MAG TPA: hypothetical protein VM487_13085 [Phycisphaerae bacterium]|nr:hypothetical protein [Phycisphaerae bacterium]